MDPHYYARYAMAGWVSAAVIILASIEAEILDFGVVNSFVGNGSLTVLLLGAIVGIGAPPAMGFLFERVTSMVLWFVRAIMWRYRSVQKFSCQERRGMVISGPEAFHACFYTYAGVELLSWTRRRRTQVYASLTSALALLVGLLVTWEICRCIPPYTGSGSAVLIGFMVGHACREEAYHRKVIEIWARAHDGLLALDYDTRLTDSLPGDESKSDIT